MVIAGAVAISALGSRSAVKARSRGAVLLIGTRVDGYEEALRSMAIPYEKVRRLSSLRWLSSKAWAGVIVAADSYPTPTVLTAPQQRMLEQYVERGGRVVIEFAQTRNGSLFGLALGSPVVAQHERLAYIGGLPQPASDRLVADDLLDEHQSCVLPVREIPEDASVLMNYGRWVGTYTVYRGETRQVGPFEHAVTIDLGRRTTISSVSARVGGEEPNYCPARVTIVTCDEDLKTKQELGAARGPWVAPLVATARFAPTATRYVRVIAEKRMGSPVEDFLVLGEIEVCDEAGRNVALGRPYRLDHFGYGDPWTTGPLTDGLIDGPWSDGRSVRIPMEAFGVEQYAGLNEPAWPALIRRATGLGEVFVLTTQAGDFRVRHYGLTAKWEALCRALVLAALPEAVQTSASQRYVSLLAFTSPRTWAQPSERVTLSIRTAASAKVGASCGTLEIGKLVRRAPGVWEAPVTPSQGLHEIAVRAETKDGSATETVRLQVATRDDAYRQALERNMRWYLGSGIMPSADARQGVRSAISISGLDGGHVEDLASPFRSDCQAMSLEAFALCSKVTGDPVWIERAKALGDILVRLQYDDSREACFGARPWLFERDESIWADDSQRNTSALLTLFGLTGDTSYLRSALCYVELAEQLSKEDGTIGWGSIQRTALNGMRRSGFRELQWEPIFSFDMLTRFDAWRATGDRRYWEEAEWIGRCYADTDIANIGPAACVLSHSDALKSAVDEFWHAYLTDPDVQAVGARRVASVGDFRYAFFNDCSINTAADPLTDQLYSTGWTALRAWRAYKATGSTAAREAALRLCDYLVRIQTVDADPRLDGAWFRGFDFERWEIYGAPYDPNYGPYHAYSGWMNAIIAQVLAMALIDFDPMQQHSNRWPEAASVLAEVRAIRVPDPVRLDVNLARCRPYTLSPAPTGPCGDDGTKLVDGVVDGHLEDGQSVTWVVPEPGGELTVEMTVDLGEVRRIAMVGQRYGALDQRRLPDHLEVLAGPTLQRMTSIGSRPVGAGVRWSAWKRLPATDARYVCLRVTKHGRAGDEFLAIGETTICEASD